MVEWPAADTGYQSGKGAERRMERPAKEALQRPAQRQMVKSVRSGQIIVLDFSLLFPFLKQQLCKFFGYKITQCEKKSMKKTVTVIILAIFCIYKIEKYCMRSIL